MNRIFLLATITSLFVLTGCGQQPSEKLLAYEENHEIIGTEKDEIIGEVSSTIYDTIDRSNSKATELIVGPITAQGEDIIPPEGRYMITAAENLTGKPQSGRVLIYDTDGVLLYETLLGMGGVDTVTVDLNGSHTVHFDGIDQAIITPVPTGISNELTAGIWEVGTDIEPGDYSITTESEFALGDLQLFEEGKSPRVFEFLNSNPETAVNIQLKEGQKLKIDNLSYLKFERVP
ncbi:hypothetical protein [Ornithinibacillus bavariensis]|uniref:Lipoprotein n=1 Tax=Ornithinibacillus bavariensis TaxID=545502 RepID=A0A920C5V3_9BACI|nr:hypothetical protein [Ornithinibacillus bavariensis]GIO25464.1 hypothetical protein J43TS3_00750 [Ornithinibacillus bavariensis]